MPANAMRGEADFGGRRLLVNFNSFCTLEQATGLKVPQLLMAMQEGLGFSDVRVWLSCFLDGEEMTEHEIGEMIGEHGYEAALIAIGTAVDGFFAKPKKEKGDRPPKAE